MRQKDLISQTCPKGHLLPYAFCTAQECSIDKWRREARKN